MATPPKGPVTVTGKQLAAIWGLENARTIQSAVHEGHAFKTGRDRYDLIRSTTAMMIHLREVAARYRSDSNGGVDTVAEAGLLRRAQREVAELKLAKLQGAVINLEDIKDAWGVVMKAVKATVLAWPNRLQVLLPHLSAEDVQVARDMTLELLKANSIVVAGDQGPLPEPDPDDDADEP